MHQGWLQRDASDSYYIYSQKMPGFNEQFGFVCLASVNEYASGLIKKHENTRKKKEDDRVALTEAQGANVGPVFLCYRSRSEIEALVSEVC